MLFTNPLISARGRSQRRINAQIIWLRGATICVAPSGCPERVLPVMRFYSATTRFRDLRVIRCGKGTVFSKILVYFREQTGYSPPTFGIYRMEIPCNWNWTMGGNTPHTTNPREQYCRTHSQKKWIKYKNISYPNRIRAFYQELEPLDNSSVSEPLEGQKTTRRIIRLDSKPYVHPVYRYTTKKCRFIPFRDLRGHKPLTTYSGNRCFLTQRNSVAAPDAPSQKLVFRELSHPKLLCLLLKSKNKRIMTPRARLVSMPFQIRVFPKYVGK